MKKTAKPTPKRKGGAKVRRVTITFYPEKKPRDQLICHFLDKQGVSTSEALHSTLLECALQNARDIAKEVYGLPESRIKHLTPVELLTIIKGEWHENKPASRVVKETTHLPQNMPLIDRGQRNEDEEDSGSYGIDDL